MILCLALDWGPDVSPSLAELFRLSSYAMKGESLCVCPTPRTLRLFPQLSVWAEEEGFSEGIWLAEDQDGVKAEAPILLIGAPPSQLLINGSETQFLLVSLHGRA